MNLFVPVRFFLRCFYLAAGIMDSYGEENIPSTGPVIVAANHICYNDPPLIAASIMRRTISFMAKKELFEVPFLGWLISRLQAFPVARGEKDIAALRKAISILKGGGILLLFPEGTRKKENKKPNAGLGFLMKQSPETAVVPVLIREKKKFLFLPRYEVRFGKVMEGLLQDNADYAGTAEKVIEAIYGIGVESRE